MRPFLDLYPRNVGCTQCSQTEKRFWEHALYRKAMINLAFLRLFPVFPMFPGIFSHRLRTACSRVQRELYVFYIV